MLCFILFFVFTPDDVCSDCSRTRRGPSCLACSGCLRAYPPEGSSCPQELLSQTPAATVMLTVTAEGISLPRGDRRLLTACRKEANRVSPLALDALHCSEGANNPDNHNRNTKHNSINSAISSNIT